MIRWLAALLAGLFLLAAPAPAQTAKGPFETRANELVSILSLKGDENTFFAPSFLAQVPAARRATLIAQRQADGGYLWDIHMQGDRETVFFEYQ